MTNKKRGITFNNEYDFELFMTAIGQLNSAHAQAGTLDNLQAGIVSVVLEEFNKSQQTKQQKQDALQSLSWLDDQYEIMTSLWDQKWRDHISSPLASKSFIGDLLSDTEQFLGHFYRIETLRHEYLTAKEGGELSSGTVAFGQTLQKEIENTQYFQTIEKGSYSVDISDEKILGFFEEIKDTKYPKQVSSWTLYFVDAFLRGDNKDVLKYWQQKSLHADLDHIPYNDLGNSLVQNIQQTITQELHNQHNGETNKAKVKIS